jgi:hypothetical protein
VSTTIVTAGSAYGYIESSSGSYSSALSGSNLIAQSGDPLLYIGQSLGSGTYFVWQAFLSFAWVVDAGSTPVAAYVRLRNDGVAGSRTIRDLELREFNWGSLVNTGDFRTRAQLAALTRRAQVVGVNASGSAEVRAGIGGADLAALDATATLRYVAVSSRNRTGAAPISLEWQTVRTAAHSSGPAPALYVASVTKHLLDLSSGAAAQLSDGTHVMLVASQSAPGPLTMDVVHHDGTTARVVDSISSVAARRGAQSFTLCADASDNVHVINDGGNHNQLNCRSYIKGAGHTWTVGGMRTAALPAYDGLVNNIAAAWHPQGGARGTIVAVVGHDAGSNTGAQTAYALISCDALLTGSGQVLRGVGDAEGTLIEAAAANGWNNYVNETSTLLDITRAEPGSARGYVTSAAKHHRLSANGAQSVARYVLNPSGTGFSSTARTIDTTSGFAVKDGDAKARTVPVSTSQFVTVHASSSDDFGLTVKHRQNTGTSSEFVVLADVRLDSEDIASMPSPAELATSSAWDAVYDPASHLVWIYYVDAADPRRLMRTHVDLSTGQAGRDEVEVAAGLGTVGSTLHAIRVHRGALTGQQVLISVAEQASGGGAHSLLTVVDTLNLPPLQPVLGARGNFDATGAADFSWTFRDPNPGDAQSSFQLEVYEVVGNTLDYDSGKISSATPGHQLPAATLANGQSYRWRVRTWDALDTEGPWSEHATFSTSASGNVSITVPATDNEDGIVTADVQIAWSVTGATQDSYRVAVHRTEDESLHSDTGWVASTATSHLVTGLTSEVEHRVEVTARAAGVASSTATRLVTPDYSDPETPVVALVSVTDDLTDDHPEAEGAYIRVEVTNPEPGQELSSLDGGFETSTDGWEPSAANELLGNSHHMSFDNTNTVAVPAQAVDGCQLFLILASNYDQAPTPPAGWSAYQAHALGATGTSDQHGLWVYTRTASAEPANYTVTWAATQWHSAAILALDNIQSFNSWTVATADTDTAVASPSIAVEPGDWVLYIGHTVESGTRTIDPAVTVLINPDRQIFVGYEVHTTSGATTAYTLDNDGPADAMAVAVLRLDESVRLERSAEQAFSGAFSGKVTVNGTPPLAGIRPAAEHRVPVTEHVRYTVSYRAYSPLGHSDLRRFITWYDEAGQLISTSSSDVAITAAEWTLQEHTASAPAGATHAGYGPSLVAPPDTMVLYVDNVVLRSATDVPIPSTNEIWRSDVENPTPVLVATIGAGSSFRDYLTASGREYAFFARALAEDGARADSEPVEGSVGFHGVWMHYPSDPEGTARRFLFGKAQRTYTERLAQESTFFAGRQAPVTEFGEHREDTFGVVVDVGNGPWADAQLRELRAFHRSARPVVIRDNRGRLLVSTLDDHSESDQEWGYQVSFTATRVDAATVVGGA